MDFGIQIEHRRVKVPVTIFYLDGTLDASSAAALEEQARLSYRHGSRYILLDFKNVPSATSTGLRAVLVIYKLLAAQDDFGAHSSDSGTHQTPFLKLSSLSAELQHLFNLTGFLQNITSYDDADMALNSFA